jgi:hypothetical protein
MFNEKIVLELRLDRKFIVGLMVKHSSKYLGSCHCTSKFFLLKIMMHVKEDYGSFKVQYIIFYLLSVECYC